MNRFKAYLAYLAIPAIPYLILIFRPDLFEPVVQFLSEQVGKRLYAVVLLAGITALTYFGFFQDAKPEGATPKLMAQAKWLLVLILALACGYLLLAEHPSYRPAVFTALLANLGVYGYLYVASKRVS